MGDGGVLPSVAVATSRKLFGGKRGCCWRMLGNRTLRSQSAVEAEAPEPQMPQLPIVTPAATSTAAAANESFWHWPTTAAAAAAAAATSGSRFQGGNCHSHWLKLKSKLEQRPQLGINLTPCAA
ncbi:hypothetical protein ACLKA7_011178 [Drosophila subpalustris]